MSEKAMIDDGFEACFDQTTSLITFGSFNTIVFIKNDLSFQCVLVRSRITAIKNECKKNTGWIRYLRCIQSTFTIHSAFISFSIAQALSISASGETGMRSIFMYTGWRVKWLAGV